MAAKHTRRPAPPRYRVNYDAKAEDGTPLKRVPRVVISRRGVRRRIRRLATMARIKLEKDALRDRNHNGRLEEGLALKYLRKVPSVYELAYEIEKISREPKPAPEIPTELGRALLTPAT
ncbi:hypothetical protein [Hyphomicrobium sp. ghe19]|uniref:hypothetical protein n=1 Tax=Hyphomicrobium sp. ghe19 TaxID=2682968 RepID=UPI0013669657|nr:hypothetical protein HYPP_03820 [Hyphomicrobium sp. ghe19]